jgi:hypothetical protein
MLFRYFIFFLFLSVDVVKSFGVVPGLSTLKTTSSSLEKTEGKTSTRRGFGHQILASVLLSTTILPQVSQAKSTTGSSPELEDIGRLKKGYERLSYLVENWEPLTTICGRTDNPYQGKNGCERSPMVVMDVSSSSSSPSPSPSSQSQCLAACIADIP